MNLSDESIKQVIKEINLRTDLSDEDKKRACVELTSSNRDNFIIKNLFFFSGTSLVKELCKTPLFINELLKTFVEEDGIYVQFYLNKISSQIDLKELLNQKIIIDQLHTNNQLLLNMAGINNFFEYFTPSEQTILINKYLNLVELKIYLLKYLPSSYVDKLLKDSTSSEKIYQELIKTSYLGHDEELEYKLWNTYKERLQKESLNTKFKIFHMMKNKTLKKEILEEFDLISHLELLYLSNSELEEYIDQDILLKKCLHLIPLNKYQKLLTLLDPNHQLVFLQHLSKYKRITSDVINSFKIETQSQIFKTNPELLYDYNIKKLYENYKDTNYLLELKKRYLDINTTTFDINILCEDDFVKLLSEEEKNIIVSKYHAKASLKIPTQCINYNDYFFRIFTTQNLKYLKSHPEKNVYLTTNSLMKYFDEKEQLEIIHHLELSSIVHDILQDLAYFEFYKNILTKHPNLLANMQSDGVSSNYVSNEVVDRIDEILPYFKSEQLVLFYNKNIISKYSIIKESFIENIKTNPNNLTDLDSLEFLEPKDQNNILMNLNMEKLRNLLINYKKPHPLALKVIYQRFDQLIELYNSSALFLFDEELFSYFDEEHKELFIKKINNINLLNKCFIKMQDQSIFNKKLLDKIIKIYSDNIIYGNNDALNELEFSEYNQNTIKYILDNGNFEGLFHILSYYNNEAVIKKIISYIKNNNKILYNEKILPYFNTFLYLLNEEDKNYISSIIDNLFYNNSLYQRKYKDILKDLSLVEKLNYLNLESKGLINDKDNLFDKLYKNNKFILITIREILFDNDFIDINYHFLEKISKYSNMELKLRKISENKTVLKFLNKASAFLIKSELNEYSYDIEISMLIEYLSSDESNLKDFAFDTITGLEMEDIINYILYEHSKLPSQNVIFLDEYYKSINEMYNLSISNFTEERLKKSDELFYQYTDINDLKNIYLNKYLSMTLTEAKNFLRTYVINYKKVLKYAKSDIPINFIKLLSKILSIEDSLTMKELYETTTISYDMKDRFIVEDIMKDAYYTSIAEEYKDKQKGKTITKTFKNQAGEDVTLNMLEMTDDFGILVHSTCAYGHMPLLNNDYYTSWNYNPNTENHGICCCYISNSSYGTPAVKDSGVMFAFTNIHNKSISVYSPYDLATRNYGYNITTSNVPYYTTLEDIPNMTRHTHNEFNLERKNNDKNSKHFYVQPDAIVIFEDMDDNIKANSIKAYEDFASHGINLQLIYIDRVKIAKNEASKIKDMIDKYLESNDLSLLSQIINKYESNICSCDFISDINKDELFMTDIIYKILNDTIDQISSLEDNIEKEKMLNHFIEILETEEAKFTLLDDFNKKRKHNFLLYDKKIKNKIEVLKNNISIPDTLNL